MLFDTREAVSVTAVVCQGLGSCAMTNVGAPTADFCARAGRYY